MTWSYIIVPQSVSHSKRKSSFVMSQYDGEPFSVTQSMSVHQLLAQLEDEVFQMGEDEVFQLGFEAWRKHLKR